jgi:anthranilate synthase component 2
VLWGLFSIFVGQNQRMKKVAIIDNYDSFTYNLVHYLEDLNAAVTVFRNDEFEVDELRFFDKIVLSPGPGLPAQAGALLEVIKTYASQKSILGVCLGMQAIAEVFGGKLINLPQVQHGVSAIIEVDTQEKIYRGLPPKIEIGRYHSWVVSPHNFPEELLITAQDEFQNIMSLRHQWLDITGVQYHPESILTPQGNQILANWLSA